MKRRAFLAGASALAVAGCSAPSVWAPDDLVQRARYVHPGPPAVTLITVKNVGSDNGAHTGLLINGPDRILFDGAGSFAHPTIPERNDVIFGMNPAVVDFYIDFHSRYDYYVITQHKLVSADTAALLHRNAQTFGPVPNAFCATRTSALLRTAPEFSGLSQTFFPDSLEEQFNTLDGVTRRVFREFDRDRQSAQFFPWVGQTPRYNIE